jgi:hypothetical protein
MIMTDIEKLIKSAATDDALLPEGHLERFEARLAGIGTAESEDEAAVTGTVTANPAPRSARVIRFITGICAVAAAIAAVIFIARPVPQQPTDWFAGVADDPVEICLAYSEKAAELSTAIIRKDLDGTLSGTVRSLSDSAVPMIDQLPEELDAATRAGILKHYYSDLLDGLDKINKNI